MTKLQTVQYYRELAKYESSMINAIKNNKHLTENQKDARIKVRREAMTYYINQEKEALANL